MEFTKYLIVIMDVSTVKECCSFIFDTLLEVKSFMKKHLLYGRGGTDINVTIGLFKRTTVWDLQTGQFITVQTPIVSD